MHGSVRYHKMRGKRAHGGQRPYGIRAQTEDDACTGKEAFGDPTTARKAAQRRVGRVAYRCQFCGHWHVGSNQR